MPITNTTGTKASDLMQNAAFNIIDSRLEAVNLCMRAIGREGVDSLTSGDLDAEDASKMIDIVSQRIQAGEAGGGWWFNREPDWELAPDSNGEVHLPNNTLSVYQDYHWNSRKVNMTIRAGKLYSITNHSFDMRPFAGDRGFVRLLLIVMLPYEHLPPTVMQYIAYQAAVEFIVSKDADKTKLQVHQMIADSLARSIMSEQSAQKRLNMFVHNPTQRLFGTMAGGYQNTPSYSMEPYNQFPPRPWGGNR